MRSKSTLHGDSGSGVYLQLGKKRIISHKKRSVFYNEVHNNKLFDCHYSDNDRICFMHECKKKGMQLVK